MKIIIVGTVKIDMAIDMKHFYLTLFVEVINISSGEEEEESKEDVSLSWKKMCRAGPNRKSAFKQLFSGYK